MFWRVLCFFLPFLRQKREFSHPFFLLVGPSMVGKDTLGEVMLDLYPELTKIVTATTRKPRMRRPPKVGMEVEGVDYHYKSPFVFRCMIFFGRLVEWQRTHGNFYGLPVSSIEGPLEQGPLIGDVDYRGALAIQERYPQVLPIVIRPKSLDVLRERMVAQGMIGKEIEIRMATAASELAAIDGRYRDKFPYHIVNDDLYAATTELGVMIGSSLRPALRLGDYAPHASTSGE